MNIESVTDIVLLRKWFLTTLTNTTLKKIVSSKQIGKNENKKDLWYLRNGDFNRFVNTTCPEKNFSKSYFL